MRNPFKRLAKLNFKGRMFLYASVVVSATFFNVFLHPMMKLFWVLVFIIFAEIFVFIYSRNLTTIIALLKHKNRDIPVPEEFSDLARKIGVEIKKYQLADGLDNAYVIGKNVVLGSGLLEKLTKEECMAVLAHEFGHIREKHVAVKFLFASPVLMLAYYSWINLPQAMLAIAFLAYLLVILTPINWYLELRADRIAKEFVGKEFMQSALLKLSEKTDRNEPSETHPPVQGRINRLENG